MEDIAQKTNGYSGADLTELSKKTVVMAIKANINKGENKKE